MDEMNEAVDRVIAGPQKRTRLMSDKEKLITAYHEGGHAMVAAALNVALPEIDVHDFRVSGYLQEVLLNRIEGAGLIAGFADQDIEPLVGLIYLLFDGCKIVSMRIH